MAHGIFSGHFQTAYVVADLERGMAFFRDKFSVAKWHIIDSSGPESPMRGIALAYVDDMMIELIEPSKLPSIYQAWLPSDGPDVRFHHLGFLVKDEENWQATLRTLNDKGIANAYSGAIPDVIDYLYADTAAQMGHFCEFVFLRPGGLGMFDPVPHN